MSNFSAESLKTGDKVNCSDSHSEANLNQNSAPEEDPNKEIDFNQLPEGDPIVLGSSSSQYEGKFSYKQIMRTIEGKQNTAERVKYLEDIEKELQKYCVPRNMSKRSDDEVDFIIDYNESFEGDTINKVRIELQYQREKLEQEKLERERLKQERLEQVRLEQVRLEQVRLEQVRLERERLEQERLERERLEQERLERERLEQEKSLSQNNKREKYTWYGTMEQLAYFVSELELKNFIDENCKYKLAAEIFKQKSGKDYNEHTLSQSYYSLKNYRKKKKSTSKIDKIFSGMPK